MKSLKKQRGLTMISWIFVAAGVGVFALVFMKLIPVYLDNYAVKGALKSIMEDDSMRASSKEQVVEAIMKRININEITDVERDNITVQKDPNQLVVDVDYAAQRQMIGNVYLFVVFNEHLDRRF